MNDVIDPTTGNSIPTGEEQTPETEEVVEEGQEEVTPQPAPTPEPLQLDPLTELEKAQLDPKVKELLKAGFMRQADYTQKTQEAARLRHAAEQILASQNNPKPKVEEPEVTEEDYPDDPKEYAKRIRQEAVKEALEMFQAEQAKRDEAANFEKQFESDVAESKKLDPRIDTDEMFTKQLAGLVQVNYGPAINKGEMTITEATKLALDEMKKNEEAFRQKVLADMDSKAKNKTMVIPNGKGSPLSTTAKGGRMSMQEAAQRAEEELNSR